MIKIVIAILGVLLSSIAIVLSITVIKLSHDMKHFMTEFLDKGKPGGM